MTIRRIFGRPGWRRPPPPAPDACVGCGGPSDPAALSLRFSWPDGHRPDPDRQPPVFGGDPVLLVPNEAGYVRVLLETRLTGDRTLLLGTWLEVDSDVARRLVEVWETPAYGAITVEGTLANAIPPWGRNLLGVQARAAVVDPAALPYLGPDGADPLLRRVLTSVWSYDMMAAALGQNRRREPAAP